MNSRLRRRVAALEALEAAQRPATPLMLPVSVVEYNEDGQVLRIVREVPGRPVVGPPDYLATVTGLWGEDEQ